ncbi:uncharacterized protein [Asterias amurensis]|uniref:uncharacterized protein n=1 Tax=Asterias amurensis TaxID=7602 RepID=UPI003AB5325B
MMSILETVISSSPVVDDDALTAGIHPIEGNTQGVSDGVFSETFDDKNPSEESDVAFISSGEVTESEEGSNHVELEAQVETSKPKEDLTPSTLCVDPSILQNGEESLITLEGAPPLSPSHGDDEVSKTRDTTQTGVNDNDESIPSRSEFSVWQTSLVKCPDISSASSTEAQMGTTVEVQATLLQDGPPAQGPHPNQESTKVEEHSLKCPECDLTFANAISLNAHQLTHKADSQFVCGICGKGFNTESLLSRHFVTHSESRRYTCTHCGRIFKNILSFQKHEKLHTVGKVFTCKDCGKAFRHKHILQKHRYSHRKKVRIEYACEHCSECFSTIKELQRHERFDHVRNDKGNQFKRLHNCKECGESFQRASQLKEHLKIHAVQKQNFCNDCGRGYASSTALLNHRCFRARKTSFACKECGRRFTSKQDVLDHERMHENEREFDCELCPKSFNSESELDDHTAVHRQPNSFKCRHCDKCFKKKGFLTNHEKSHKTKKLRTQKVGKSKPREPAHNHIIRDLDKKTSEQQHESVFIESEGVYKCKDCGKTFKQKGQTINHQRKETNQRTFVCTQCPNTYITSAHLKAHVLTHSKNAEKKCEGCGREFNYKSNLTSHQRQCPQMAGKRSAVTNHRRRYNHQAKSTTSDGIDNGSKTPHNGDTEEETTQDDTLRNSHDEMKHVSYYNKEMRMYECKDCGQTFKQKGQTVYHQRKVSNERLFVCKVCKKAFLTSPHLKAHELVHTTEKPLCCAGCGKRFNYKCNLKTHQRNGCVGLNPEGEPALSKMKLFKCEECGKEFKLKLYFDKHQKMHEHKRLQQEAGEVVSDLDEMGRRKEHLSDYNEEDGTYKCRDCGLLFKQSGQALYHVRKYSNERRFVCKVCPKSFLTSAHLKSHIMSHTKEKPYKCWYCGKGFNHNSNRKYHQRISCNERPAPGEGSRPEEESSPESSKGQDEVKKPIECVVCNKQFKLSHSWKVHMRVHTREQPFLCEYCGKAFRCRSNLYVHRNSHTKERPFLCNYCGKNFAQLSHVRVHEAIHSTEKPYKCEICDKSFNQEFYLKRHKVMHTDDRPFSCSCGKSFKYRGSLVSHKATHSPKRPYSCHLCEKAFKQSCHLKVHILTHGETKPYKCDKCQKAFIRKNQLSRHQRSHSDERCYACPVCGKDFKHSSSMKRHQERKHKENVETSVDTATQEAQPVYDSLPFPQTPTEKDDMPVAKPKTQWPAPVLDGRANLEQGSQMNIGGQMEASNVSAQRVDNRVLTQMDGTRMTSQPVDCRMTNQPIDYRVSPQMPDGRIQASQSLVSGHLGLSGHPVYSEAQYIQGPEFASVHLPHIGTFDFRTNTTGNVDYTVL